MIIDLDLDLRSTQKLRRKDVLWHQFASNLHILHVEALQLSDLVGQ